MTEPLLLFDTYAGMGGWSIGFYREGFRCIGIDIRDVGYPYELIKCDIREFSGKEYRGKVKAMTISPPCTEFSQITKLSAWKGQRPQPDPEKGMELVREGIRVMKEIQPQYWILENVYGSRQYISDLLGPPKVEAKPFLLWGNFPHFMFEVEPRKTSKSFHHGPWNWADNTKGFTAGKDPETGKYVIGKNFAQLNDWSLGKGGDRKGLPEDFAFDPLRSYKRARIPVFLAQTIARACKSCDVDGNGTILSGGSI